MKSCIAHRIQFMIRVTEEEDRLLDELYFDAMTKCKKRITRAAFIRQTLIKICKRNLKKDA